MSATDNGRQAMKPLQFEGSSDDTFGEYGRTNVDFDNCANGTAIYLKVWSPSKAAGLVVMGHYCAGPATGWVIGVGRISDDDETALPDWPMRLVCSDREYTPRLEIDAPEDAAVTVVTPEGDEWETQA